MRNYFGKGFIVQDWATLVKSHKTTMLPGLWGQPTAVTMWEIVVVGASHTPPEKFNLGEFEPVENSCGHVFAVRRHVCFVHVSEGLDLKSLEFRPGLYSVSHLYPIPILPALPLGVCLLPNPQIWLRVMPLLGHFWAVKRPLERGGPFTSPCAPNHLVIAVALHIMCLSLRFNTWNSNLKEKLYFVTFFEWFSAWLVDSRAEQAQLMCMREESCPTLDSQETENSWE